MKKVVGFQKIESKKNGKKYTVIHMMDDDFKNEINTVGNMVSSEMISEDVEVVGDMKIGSGVRIFKEEVNGFDRATVVHFINDVKPEKTK